MKAKYAITSPLGVLLYYVGEDEAKYLVRTGQGKVHYTKKLGRHVQLRTVEVPGWMYGTRYVYREDLPDRDYKTCWCYALRELRPDTINLYRLAQLDCIGPCGDKANRRGKGKSR